MHCQPAFNQVELIEAQDLRRTRSRGFVAEVARQAQHLPPTERALLLQVFSEGKTVAEIAKERGEPPRRLARRIKRLTSRVLDPRYRYVTEHRQSWRPTRRKVAGACVIEGLSIREAAAKLRLSPYTVRKQREAIDALFESADLGSH